MAQGYRHIPSNQKTHESLGERGGSRASRRATLNLPGAGPGLAPTAQRLLDAARRVLARSGYNSLSVEAIGREAGENKALVRYYFGSKNGLLLALVDELVSDTLRRTRQRLSTLSSAKNGPDFVVEAAEAIIHDQESYRLLFDLLPRLLENPSMTRQLAELYRGYRELNARALWGDRDEQPPEAVRNVATMTVALSDGLAVQLLAEPKSVDVTAVLKVWRSFVEGVLASATASSSTSTPAVSAAADKPQPDPRAGFGATQSTGVSGVGQTPWSLARRSSLLLNSFATARCSTGSTWSVAAVGSSGRQVKLPAASTNQRTAASGSTFPVSMTISNRVRSSGERPYEVLAKSATSESLSATKSAASSRLIPCFCMIRSILSGRAAFTLT